MKRKSRLNIHLLSVSIAAAVIAMVAFPFRTLAQTPRTDTLQGQLDGPGTSDFAVRADSSGDLPGVLELRLSLAGGAIAGGSWSLAVQEQNADGSWTMRGAVKGSVVGGSVTLTNNSVSEIRSLQLTLDSGEGEYAGANGVGTLAGSVTPDASVQFTGTLSLTF